MSYMGRLRTARFGVPFFRRVRPPWVVSVISHFHGIRESAGGRVTMRGVSKHAAISAILCLIAGCADATGTQTQKEASGSVAEDDIDDAVTSDWSHWDWPAADVAVLTDRAERGDVEAAQRLWDYYIVHEDGNTARYWQNWLFARGDREAMSVQVGELYRSARKRGPHDPHKLVELREAERLYALLEREGPEYRDSYMMEDIRAETAAAQAGKVRHIQSEEDHELDLKASELFDQAVDLPDQDPEKLGKLRAAQAHYNRMSRQMSAMDATTLRRSNLSHLLRSGERAVASRTLVEREIQRLEDRYR